MIPKETMPSEDERIILEHTYQTYIAPPCFQEADATNFLEDADLEKAYELNYDVNDTCTEEFFQSEKDSLFVNILKRIGLMKTKWDK